MENRSIIRERDSRSDGAAVTPAGEGELVEQNRILRERVEVLDYCRSIATSLEIEKVAGTSLQILATLCGARFGVFSLQRGQKTVDRVLATYGITKKDAKAVLDQVDTQADFQDPVSMKWLRGPAITLSSVSGPAFIISFHSEQQYAANIVFGMGSRDGMTRERKQKINLVAEQTLASMNHAIQLQKAHELALIDDLTGLYNTRFLELVVEKEMKRARRQHYPISFLFIDLDHFKSVNDRYGHLVGSELLVAVGEELRDLVRDIDMIVRFGGDEFVVILINTLTEGACQVAERIRQRIAGKAFLAELGVKGAEDVRISTSIGISTYPDHANNKETILRLADEAMYRAKTASRNAIYVATV